MEVLKDKASAKTPRVNYAYPIYASTSPGSGQLHASTVMRANSTQVLVSYNPSFQARILHLPFREVSNILVARRRCSRINKLSSLHPFYHFNSIPVCTRRCISSTLHLHVPCYFMSRHCPNIPSVPLRRVSIKRGFFVGAARIVPLHIVRKQLPVLNCHVKRLNCVASVLAVPRRSCRRLTKVSILVIGTLQVTPRPARRSLRRTLTITRHVQTGGACFVRVDRSVNLRTRIRQGLPRGVRLTCSKLRVLL